MNEVLVDVADGVMTLTINRPDKRNSVNQAVIDGLDAGLRQARRDDDVKVLVLRGAEGYFSAGIDLPYAMKPGMDRLNFLRMVGELAIDVYRLPIPSISVIEGGAVGLSCNLALACDLTVATEDAMLCEAFTRLNLTIDGGGAWLLPRLVGLKKAKELVFFADKIPAREAERLGLVNCVVAAGDLDAQLKDWTSRLAGGPATPLSLSKTMLNDSFALSFEQAIEQESRGQWMSATGAAKAIGGALKKPSE